MIVSALLGVYYQCYLGLISKRLGVYNGLGENNRIHPLSLNSVHEVRGGYANVYIRFIVPAGTNLRTFPTRNIVKYSRKCVLLRVYKKQLIINGLLTVRRCSSFMSFLDVAVETQQSARVKPLPFNPACVSNRKEGVRCFLQKITQKTPCFSFLFYFYYIFI